MLASEMQTLVNPVNTVGIMGKGLALIFKNKYPEMFAEYKIQCYNSALDIGKLFIWEGEKKQIICFPTKKNWRDPSRLEYIESGLDELVRTYKGLTIAFPMLGCGLGGLDWVDVKPLMEKYLNKLDSSIEIYIK